jgi:dTDP-4-dehydrorhamnose reductase
MIWVVGSNGQLASCFKNKFNISEAVFTSSKEVDVVNLNSVYEFVTNLKPSLIINCSAYTAVDKAETEVEAAYKINVTGVENLATVSRKFKIPVIHFSTDFVFDGKKTSPYFEGDETGPTGVYGKTKLEGENKLRELAFSSTIIRISWLYSPFGKNFVKTMIELSKLKKKVSVVSDQVGCPTYGPDLVDLVVNNLTYFRSHKTHELYHFSNEGEISWYDFAEKVMTLSGKDCKVNPISTDQYTTLATRPKYSLLDLTKTKNKLNYLNKEWTISLRQCLNELSC